MREELQMETKRRKMATEWGKWEKWSARNGNKIPNRRNGRMREMAIRYQVGEMAE